MWITTMSTYNLLLILLAAIATGSTSSDHYLLSCGTSSSVANTPSVANSTALETAYRLNVGGGEVGSEEDSGTMYRQWENDEKYLIGFVGLTGLLDNQTLIKYTAVTPNYSAPGMVYQTLREMGIDISNEQRMRVNLTWGFEVDVGFNYLLRLHWCEDAMNVNASGYRVFDVYIDKLTAEDGVDVFGWVGGLTAVYRDYVVYMDTGGGGNGSRGVLQLAMHPLSTDILLNGLEIFKLSRPDGSLDAPNPDRPRIPTPNQQPTPKSPFHTNVLIITGSVVGSILLALVVYYLFVRRGRCCFLESADPNSNTSSSKKMLITLRTNTGSSSSSSSQQCRIFMLSDIKSATSDFNDASIIGIGGFGIVYVGTLDGTDHGPIKVAIKRLKPSSKQGNNEFRTEIEMLSNLRHEHLVGLIGYCDEQGEMILVYEYMQSGTLCDRLYDTDSSPLSWNQRLQVCVGAAMGLHYLHEGGKHKIIHRDIKSSNILLDDRLVAKVSDFGLSRVGPMSEGLDHISTRVKGSLGYVDPEYIRRRQLTEKSDVYSLGVVLFEVLCGRPAVNPNLPKEQMNLAIWARSHKKRGSLEDIVDPNLKGQIEPECLRMFGEIAERCVRNNGIDRPSAAELLQALLDICLKEAKNDGEKA